MQGLVLSLRSNGFIAYVPAFDAKGPVYISDRDGQVQVRGLRAIRYVGPTPVVFLFFGGGALIPIRNLVNADVVVVVDGCPFRSDDESSFDTSEVMLKRRSVECAIRKPST